VTLGIETAEFLLSVVRNSDFPPLDQPEIAFSGRSNVGKSTLLNLLAGRKKKLAKVSRAPGKTRAVNFFGMVTGWRLVDLPGYGYAKGSKTEIERWRKVTHNYLTTRRNLVGVVQLLDSRHSPSQLDGEMMKWLSDSQMPTVVALTKVDKLKSNERREIVRKFQKLWLKELNWPVIPTSSQMKIGREDLLSEIEKFLRNDGWGGSPPE